jgi:hypothetical protein
MKCLCPSVIEVVTLQEALLYSLVIAYGLKPDFCSEGAGLGDCSRSLVIHTHQGGRIDARYVFMDIRPRTDSAHG